MRKILFSLTVILVMVLGACESAPDTDVRITDLENEVISLQEQITDLETRIDNIVGVTGLNGQEDFYENESNTELSMTSYLYLTTTEKDYIDKTLFPDYIWNSNGDYVSVDDLSNMLVAKYFNGTTATATTGFQYRISFSYENKNMSNEEFIARLSLLIIELSEYDFYTIDTSQLYFYINFNGMTIELQARMSLLVNDSYSLSPAIFYEQLLDTRISGIYYDKLVTETYCNELVLTIVNDYVLDYTK